MIEIQLIKKKAKWYQSMIARWNHERTLRRFAANSPFTPQEIRDTYNKVDSYEKLKKVIDLAQAQGKNLPLAVVTFTMLYEVEWNEIEFK